MPKPQLNNEDAALEQDIIEVLLAGLKEWRPDLQYPQSHSDMSGCVRNMMRLFDIKRRSIVRPLRLHCHRCMGIGEYRHWPEPHSLVVKECPDCKGKGYKEG